MADSFISRGEAGEWVQKPAMKGNMNPREKFKVRSKTMWNHVLFIGGVKRPDMHFRKILLLSVRRVKYKQRRLRVGREGRRSKCLVVAEPN